MFIMKYVTGLKRKEIKNNIFVDFKLAFVGCHYIED